MALGTQSTHRPRGARAHRVFQAAAVGAGTRATGVAEAASTQGMTKKEHTLAQDKVEVVLALEREENRSTAVLHLANPSWRGCPCECTSVAKTIQLRLDGRRRGKRVANGYKRDQCLVPDTVLGSSHKACLRRQESGGDACSVRLEVGSSQPSIGEHHSVTTMGQANPSHTQRDGRDVGRVQTSKRRVDRVPSTSRIANGQTHLHRRSHLQNETSSVVAGKWAVHTRDRRRSRGFGSSLGRAGGVRVRLCSRTRRGWGWSWRRLWTRRDHWNRSWRRASLQSSPESGHLSLECVHIVARGRRGEGGDQLSKRLGSPGMINRGVPSM